jgi:pimeloyl-ACP methyl ester carboxylesterase
VPFARCHGAHRIHYAERGEPRPPRRPTLLIHGAGASAAIWTMAMAHLARFTRAVAIDLPGHGPSPAVEDGARPPTLVDYRNATGELAASLGLGPSVLVGHSMGALVAIEAALAWPDKVAGLVLCAAAPRLPVDPELVEVLRHDYAGFPRWLAQRALSDRARPSLKRGFVAAGLAAPQSVTLADFEALAAGDVGPRLATLRCPMIWLDGADDQIVGPPPHRPGQARRLGGVGHLVPIEAPAEVSRAALELAARGPA